MCSGLGKKGPGGQYYKHRKSVRYINDFYMDITMGDCAMTTAMFYPVHFPRVTIANKPLYDISGMMKPPYYHKEGEAQPELRTRIQSTFYA